MKKMDNFKKAKISLRKFLEDVKSYEINQNLEPLQKYTETLFEEENELVDSQELNHEKLLNECIQWVSNYIFQLPTNNADEQIIFRTILFIFSISKLNILQKENVDYHDLRLLIINNGCKLVKLCSDKKYFSNIEYFVKQTTKELNEIQNFCNEDNLLNRLIITKRIEFTMYNVENLLKQNKLMEAMEELNRQKDCILKLNIFHEYYVGLCYNISLKCNHDENYDYALTVMLLAYDVCKVANQLSKNMKKILRFLVSLCLKFNPNKNWQNGINALDMVNKTEIDMFYITRKIKFSFIAQQQNLLEEALNQAAEWDCLKVKDIIQITQLLQTEGLSVPAAEFVQTVRYKNFSMNDKFSLMKLEIQIYISENDRKVYNLIENAIDSLKWEVTHHNNIEETSILSLYQLLLSHANVKNKEKNFKDSLTWYIYCEQICEIGRLHTTFLRHIQTRICLCYIEINEWKSAKEIFYKLKNSSSSVDSFYMYLALQIAIMEDDDTLVTAVFKKCDESDNKTEDILLLCCHKALSSGKKCVSSKILETMLMNHRNPDGAVLTAKISQCLIEICADSTGKDIDISEKYLLYMDKALENLQQNSHYKETSDLSQWFSRAAWNLALTPDIEPKYTFEFFLRCCCFSEISEKHLNRLKNSLMLAAASGLRVVRKMKSPGDGERESILGKIMTVIEKYKSLETGANIVFLRLLHLYEFEVKCHLNQWEGGNESMKKIFHLPFMDTKTLEHIAAIVNEFSPNNYQIIVESLKAAVKKISESEKQETSEVSKTYHSLIQVLFHVQEYFSSPVEEENLTFCNDLLTMIENKTLQNYPQLEILWLMIKCWNCGIQKLSLNDPEKAYKWCTLAMAFLQKLETLKILYGKKLNDMYIAYFPDNKDEKA